MSIKLNGETAKIATLGLSGQESKTVDVFLGDGNFLWGIRSIGSGAPWLEPYESFYPGGPFHFLATILPLEVWYIIFEWKFWLEKVDYVLDHFGPRIIENIRLNARGRWVYNGVKPSLAANLLREMKTIQSEPGTPCGGFQTVSRLKQYIINWFPVVRTISDIHRNDGQMFCLEGFEHSGKILRLFEQSELIKLSGYISLYRAMYDKVRELRLKILYNNHINCCPRHSVMAKIIIYDTLHFMDIQQFYGDPLHPDHQGSYDDYLFTMYFQNFEEWCQEADFQDPLDILDIIPEEYDAWYYNPYWFHDVDGQPALWRMVQENSEYLNF